MVLPGEALESLGGGSSWRTRIVGNLLLGTVLPQTPLSDALSAFFGCRDVNCSLVPHLSTMMVKLYAKLLFIPLCCLCRIFDHSNVKISNTEHLF